MTNKQTFPWTVPTRLSRRLLALLFVMVVSISGLIAAVPLLFSADDLAEQFLAALHTSTGSHITSSKPVELSLFPSFKAVLRDVVTTDKQAPLNIEAEAIEIGLSAWQMMLGRFEISSLRFVNAEVKIRLPDTHENTDANSLNIAAKAFTFFGHQISDGAATPRLQRLLKLNSLSLVDSTLTIVDRLQKNEQVSKLNATINWPHPTNAATLNGVANWRGAQVIVLAGISDPLAFASGKDSDVTLNINSNRLVLSFVGKSNLGSTFYADGSVLMNVPSMSQFLLSADAGLTLGSDVGAVDLEAKLSTKNGVLLFDDLTMQLAATSAVGALEIDPLASPVKMSGTLAFKTVDLAAISSALPIGATQQLTDNAEQLKALDLALDLDLRLSAKVAKIDGYLIEDAAGAIRIANGDASLDLGTGTFAGGTLHARLDISGAQEKRVGKLNVELLGLRQDQIENLAQNLPIFDGPLSGSFEIGGVYTGLAALLASGDGALRIDFPSGVIRNFNLESMRLAMDSTGIFELQSVYAGMSEASALGVVGLIKNGVVLVTSAKAEIAGQNISLTGAIPLVSGSLALQGSITDATPSATKKLKPFFIGGTLQKPLVTAIVP